MLALRCGLRGCDWREFEAWELQQGKNQKEDRKEMKRCKIRACENLLRDAFICIRTFGAPHNLGRRRRRRGGIWHGWGYSSSLHRSSCPPYPRRSWLSVLLRGGVVFSIHLSQNFGQYLGKTCSGTKPRVKPNSPNGSPDNGSIQIMVRVWARPILKWHCSENCSDNGSIQDVQSAYWVNFCWTKPCNV